jgi:hypothetical protein
MVMFIGGLLLSVWLVSHELMPPMSDPAFCTIEANVSLEAMTVTMIQNVWCPNMPFELRDGVLTVWGYGLYVLLPVPPGDGFHLLVYTFGEKQARIDGKWVAVHTGEGNQI